jgi:hypothetical protein
MPSLLVLDSRGSAPQPSWRRVDGWAIWGLAVVSPDRAYLIGLFVQRAPLRTALACSPVPGLELGVSVRLRWTSAARMGQTRGTATGVAGVMSRRASAAPDRSISVERGAVHLASPRPERFHVDVCCTTRLGFWPRKPTRRSCGACAQRQRPIAVWQAARFGEAAPRRRSTSRFPRDQRLMVLGPVAWTPGRAPARYFGNSPTIAKRYLARAGVSVLTRLILSERRSGRPSCGIPPDRARSHDLNGVVR